MRRLVVRLVVVSLLVAGCDSGTLDPAVQAELRIAVPQTLDQMGVPPSGRPSARGLEDQVSLLALQVDRARLDDLRSGAYDQARLREDAADLERWTARVRHEHGLDQQPPAMLDHLRRAQSLTPEQRVLMHALIRQGRRETGWKPAEQ